MSDRLPDADRAVDEQKRRARRRLVGAVVLAAAAAVIVPMLLEKEPQPLGEDVSVQIPPVDEGKFVNRLTRSKPRRRRGTDSEAGTEERARPTRNRSCRRPDAAKSASPNAEAAQARRARDARREAGRRRHERRPAAPRPLRMRPRLRHRANAVAAAESKMPATPAAQGGRCARCQDARRPKPAPAPGQQHRRSAPVAPAPDAKSAPAAGFAVQLAAFSDDKGANAYANKLRKAGYASAHVEAVDTSRGKLWRVRVGGFATRAEAEAARVKLESKGFVNGMVAPAR